MMHLHPRSVKTGALARGDVPDEVVKRRATPVHEGRFFDETTRNGCLGDARLATPEIGREMVETGLDRAAAYLEEFISAPMPC
jgi:creatinine amidohydrolase/Fe(II)-dependent formamide hydrolase-like protein